MESLPASEEVPMGTVTADETPKEDVKTVENDADNTDTSAAEKPKLDEGESAPAEKKRRSGGRRNRCDTDIMVEARAAYGELDASEGRSLRKRPEPKEPPPAKKASPKKSTTPRGRKKQVVEDEVKEEDAAKLEVVDTGEPADSATETPAVDTDDTTEHQADVKEVAEETAPAETKQEEPAPVQSETSSSVEVAADAASSLPAAEALAEPKHIEEQETPTAMEQGPAESTAAAAALSSE